MKPPPIFMTSQITFLDEAMSRGDVRIIKSPEELLGFNIKNETGEHLFIEIKRLSGFLAPGDIDIEELIIKK